MSEGPPTPNKNNENVVPLKPREKVREPVSVDAASSTGAQIITDTFGKRRAAQIVAEALSAETHGEEPNPAVLKELEERKHRSHVSTVLGRIFSHLTTPIRETVHIHREVEILTFRIQQLRHIFAEKYSTIENEYIADRIAGAKMLIEECEREISSYTYFQEERLDIPKTLIERVLELSQQLRRYVEEFSVGQKK